jgi:hypothetical protein
MTPQAPPRGRGPGLGAGRYSVDGIRRATGIPTERETEREDGAFGGARRVRLETKWKVGDIVVPVEKDTAGYNKESQKTPLRGAGRVTEEERKVCFILCLKCSFFDLGNILIYSYHTGNSRAQTLSSKNPRHLFRRTGAGYTRCYGRFDSKQVCDRRKSLGVSL